MNIVIAYHRDRSDAPACAEASLRGDIADVAHRIQQVLAAAGHDVTLTPVTEHVARDIQPILANPPDVVFNLCEALGGDPRLEPLLPLMLEAHRIAYTGSGPTGLMLAANKPWANQVLRAHGVRTPPGVAITTGKSWRVTLPFPLIVKPAREDGSAGISAESVVHEPSALAVRVDHVRAQYAGPVLVERYVAGRELHVSLLERPGGGIDVLPATEIDFTLLPADQPRILSHDAKWASDNDAGARFVSLAGLPPVLAEQVRRAAVTAFHALELRDYARVDMRVDEREDVYVLDVNPNCDLSDEQGSIAQAARSAGIEYRDLIVRLTALAYERALTRRGGPPAGRALA